MLHFINDGQLRTEMKHIWPALVFFGALIAGLILLFVHFNNEVAKDQASCAASGGVIIMARNGDVCVSKDAVIRRF